MHIARKMEPPDVAASAFDEMEGGRPCEPLSEVEFARNHYRLRRLRDKMFPTAYFSDPGWEILLELYLCQCDSLELSASYLGYAASIPPTTTLRYIAQLEQDGYVERIPCETDRRRTITRLTETGHATMSAIMKEGASRLFEEMIRQRQLPIPGVG